MTYEEFLPKRLAQLRQMKGVSARDMSLTLGQGENYINSIENRKTLPSMRSFFVILEYLNVTIQEFFDDTNANPEAINELVSSLKKLHEDDIVHLQHIINRMASS